LAVTGKRGEDTPKRRNSKPVAHMRSRISHIVTLCLMLVSLVGCGGSDSTRPEDRFSGDYVLQTINAQPLPYTWTFTGGSFYRLNSYRFTILPGGSTIPGADGGWISATSYAYTDQGQVVSRPDSGEIGMYTYTPSSGLVSLLSQDETTFFVGQLSTDGRTLTITENGDVWVFTK
jgi:hypothetical protein